MGHSNNSLTTPFMRNLKALLDFCDFSYLLGLVKVVEFQLEKRERAKADELLNFFRACMKYPTQKYRRNIVLNLLIIGLLSNILSFKVKLVI